MSGVMDRPRILRISSAITDAGEVLVAVEDAGTGLSPDAADRIFEPLFTTKPSGMGMGLSVCRSIVEAHGGRLSALSNSPYGTIFRFTVPCLTPAGETNDHLNSGAARMSARN
jgi:signal transduction histidine kinase